MQRLHLAEGDRIRIQGARLPKGKFVKVQAQSVDFLELSDPKAVYVSITFSSTITDTDEQTRASFPQLRRRERRRQDRDRS